MSKRGDGASAIPLRSVLLPFCPTLIMSGSFALILNHFDDLGVDFCAAQVTRFQEAVNAQVVNLSEDAARSKEYLFECIGSKNLLLAASKSQVVLNVLIGLFAAESLQSI